MNIQTERLANHTARFTVEIEPNQLEQAKQTAARNLAKRVTIPGFRKGKAPYRVLVSYVGEGAVLEDAIEILGNDVYKQALDQSGINPYGPGELENFALEPKPTFTFIVPLQPSVDLADYRATRLPFEAGVVDDEDVNRSLKSLQEQHVLVEPSHQPVAAGNQVTLDIHGEFTDMPDASEAEAEAAAPETPADSAEEAEDGDDHDHEHDHEEMGENVFAHQHDAMLILDEEREEPSPGFFKALEGMIQGETREFEVEYPDDQDEYEDLAGRKAKFRVTVKKIETRTLPILNDDFAARVTAKEEKPLSLLELRMRVRENLQKAADQRAKSEFARQALDTIVEQAAISFPDALVEDQIEDYLKRLDQELRQRGLTLADYIRITGNTKEKLGDDYRETAIANLKRSLTLREIVRAEQMEVADPDVDAEIERIISQFGEQAESLRSMFTTANMRGNVRNDLLEQHVLDRVVAIAKGEAPELLAAQPDVLTSSE